MSRVCEKCSPTRRGSTSRIPWPPGETTSASSRRAPKCSLRVPTTRFAFVAPGPISVIGLLPDAHWGNVTGETAWGQTYLANMPTEEVFTTPDCRRTHGLVTMTRPFADFGAYVTGMSLRFEHGRLVEASATEGEAWLRQMLATDDGASMVGEIALVPAHNRLSELELDLLPWPFRRERLVTHGARERHHGSSPGERAPDCRGTTGSGDVDLDRAPRLHDWRARDRRLGRDEGRPGRAAHGWRQLAVALVSSRRTHAMPTVPSRDIPAHSRIRAAFRGCHLCHYGLVFIPDCLSGDSTLAQPTVSHRSARRVVEAWAA